MKHFLSCIVLFCSLVAPAFAASPRNFVTNGDFEEIGGNGMPVGWYILDEGRSHNDSYKQHQILFKSEPNIVHKGRRAASLLHEDGSYRYWVMLRQDLRLPPGEYVYTGYVFWQGRSIACPIVAMHLIDDRGGVTAPEAYRIMGKPSPDNWIPFSMKFKVDAGIKTVGLNVIATNGPAHLYIDDVGVYRADEAPVMAESQEAKPPVIPAVMGHPTLSGVEHTPYYSVKSIQGVWYLVTPDGLAYFDRGINHCSYPGANNWWDQLNPDRGRIVRQLFPKESDWQEYVLKCVKDWGFTSLGAWSYEKIAPAARQNGIQVWSSLAVDWVGSPRYTLQNQQGGIIPIGGTTRMADPFNPEWRRAVTEHIQRVLKANGEQVMGYFAENENSLGVVPLYGYAWTPSARKAMSAWLADRYGRDIASLNASWVNRDGAASTYQNFDDAVKNPPAIEIASLMAQSSFMKDMDAFEDYIVETYVNFIVDTVRKNNPHVLLTSPRLPGSRFADYKPLRHFAKFDIVAVNCYGNPRYGSKQLDDLKAIYELTGRPILITEWCASQDKPTDSQSEARERAARYSDMMHQISALPFVVGMHWQMWFAATKSDGGKMGLVDDSEKPLPFVSLISDVHREFMVKR